MTSTEQCRQDLAFAFVLGVTGAAAGIFAIAAAQAIARTITERTHRP